MCVCSHESYRCWRPLQHTVNVSVCAENEKSHFCIYGDREPAWGRVHVRLVWVDAEGDPEEKKHNRNKEKEKETGQRRRR